MTWLVLFSTLFGSTFSWSLQTFLFLDILAEHNHLDSALFIEIHYCYCHGLCHSHCLGLHSHPPKPFTFFDSNKWKNVRFVAGHESGKRVTLGGTATVQDDNYLKGGFLQIIKKNRSQRARETHMYYYTTTQAYRCSVLLVTNSTLPKDYECGGGGEESPL